MRLARLLMRSLVRALLGSPDIVALSTRRACRGSGMVWGRTLYAGTLLGIVALIAALGPGDAESLPRYGNYFFGVLCAVQLSVAMFVPPIVMAQTMAEERSRGTAGLLLMTHRNPADVVRALLTGRLLIVILILLSGAPVASMAALLGGVSLQNVLFLTAGSILVAIGGGALGALLGADVPPRMAPFVALLGVIMTAWMAQYPLMILGFAAAGMAAAGAPVWLIAVALAVLVAPPILLFHRVLTRHAGMTLLRRLAEPPPVINAPPPASRMPKPRAGIEHQQVLRVLSPGLSRVPMGLLFRGTAILVLGGVAVSLIPTGISPAELLRGAGAGLCSAAAIGILMALFGAATIFPALRLSRLRSESTLVLVALCPIDVPAMLRELERRALAIAALAVAAVGGLLLPVALMGGVEGLPHLAASGSLTLILVIGILALSARVGASARTPLRAMGTMMGTWVALLGSLLLAGIWDAAVHHPLALPFTVAAGKVSLLSGAMLGWLILPAAYLLRQSTWRTLTTLWREPFESLVEGSTAFD